MPYKDPAKQREAWRRRSARYRKRKATEAAARADAERQQVERQAEAIHRRQQGWTLLRLLRPMRVTFENGLGFVDLEPGARFWVREGVAHEWLRRGDAEPLSTGEIVSLSVRAITKEPDTFESLEEPDSGTERTAAGY